MKYFNTMSHNKALEGLCMKCVSLCQCVRLFAGVEQSTNSEKDEAHNAQRRALGTTLGIR